MATYTVTTSSDASDATDGLLTLREALALADANPGVDTIVFAADIGDRVITLAQGQLNVASDLTIDGGNLGITIDAASKSQAMVLDGPLTQYTAVTLESLTITGGMSGDDGTASFGGGIHSAPLTNLTLIDTTVIGNSAYGAGGGIYAGGELILTGSVVSNNKIVSTSGSGGGIYGRKSVTLDQSTISDNSSVGSAEQSVGGGIFVEGELKLIASTVSGNEANSFGGGIFALADATLINSTVANNRVAGGHPIGEGGGVFGAAGINLYDSTLTGNYAGSIGGGAATTGSLKIVNTIAVGNYVKALAAYDAGVDIFSQAGGTTSNGHNVFGSIVYGSIAGDITAVGAEGLFAVVVAPSQEFGIASGGLADNGGPTETVALLNSWSDVALGQSAPGSLDTDQRGEPRPAPGQTNPDAGAYQLQEPPPSQTGTPGREGLKGSAEGGALFGFAGADRLYGRAGIDRLDGGAGHDRLYGGQGGDILVGGAGTDLFVVRAGAQSRPDDPDRILDFSRDQGDRIDLRPLDADRCRPGDQRLEFIGTDAVTGAGQVRAIVDGPAMVEVNLDRDSHPELLLLLHGAGDLQRSDFLL